jgi:hypothetical protein
MIQRVDGRHPQARDDFSDLSRLCAHDHAVAIPVFKPRWRRIVQFALVDIHGPRSVCREVLRNPG